MLSGFLSSGNLCLINHLKLFWFHTASTASDRKVAWIQHEFSWFCQKKKFFKHQNIAILDLKLLNSRIWRTLKSTVVILQALETSPASLTSVASATSLASTASKAQFPQKTSWSWWSDHHWHQNNPYWQFFCGMDHQKSNFSLIYGTFLSEAIEAEWGQKSFKWLIRHKFPLLRKPLSISF